MRSFVILPHFSGRFGVLPKREVRQTPLWFLALDRTEELKRAQGLRGLFFRLKLTLQNTRGRFRET